MGLSCALGLAACLNYGGASIHVDDAINVMDSCDAVESIQMTPIRIEVYADSISAITGQRIEWPPRSSLSTKVLAVRRECLNFRHAFNDESAWEHLEKWPY